MESNAALAGPRIATRLSGYGPGDFNVPRLAVVHAMGEYIKFQGKIYSAAEWLEFKGLSAHVLIHPNGDQTRIRKDTQCAHHAKGYNINSLGVEVLVPGDHNYASFVEALRSPWTSPEQIESLVWLSLGWRKEHSLLIPDFQRHSDISPERKVDPGKGFPWGEYLAQLTLFPEEF